MSVFYDRQDELEKYEFMMGEARGRLAVTLDVLTDALVLVGQHGVYCTSARNPKVRYPVASVICDAEASVHNRKATQRMNPGGTRTGR